MECLLQSVTMSHIFHYLVILFYGLSWIHPHLIHNLLELLDTLIFLRVNPLQIWSSPQSWDCGLYCFWIKVLVFDYIERYIFGFVPISLSDPDYTALVI